MSLFAESGLHGLEALLLLHDQPRPAQRPAQELHLRRGKIRSSGWSEDSILSSGWSAVSILSSDWSTNEYQALVG